MSKTKGKSRSFTDTDVVIQAQTIPAVPQTPEYVAGTVTDGGFVIEERDIPKRSGRTGTLVYPIEKLAPGSKDSFLVPAATDKIKNVTSSIRTFAFRKGFKVTLRAEATGVRVWRKAPKA